MKTPAATAPEAPLAGDDAPQPLLDRNGRVALTIFVVLEAVSFAFYLWFGRRQWFFLDEWDFLAGRDLRNVDDLLRPHVVHWTTLPIVVYRGMWSIFGINSYLPYQMLSVANHLVVAALLRVVMRRAGVGPWIATTVAGVFLLFGAGNHNILWAFQIAFTLPLTFGLAHMLLADHEGRIDRRDWLGLGAGLAAIMSSGVGPPMVVAVGLAVLWRRGWRLALFHTVPLALIYALWWLQYGRHADDGIETSSARENARFVSSGYRAMFDALGATTVVGVVLFATLVVGLALAWRNIGRLDVRRRAAGPAGLLVAGVLFMVVTGWGRGGSAQAAYERSSRYLYVIAALTAPALAVASQALYHRWRWLGPPVLALLLVGVPHNVGLTVDYPRGISSTGAISLASEQTILGRNTESMVLALPRLPLAADAPRDVRPFPGNLPEITLGWLRTAASQGKLPDPGTIAGDTRAMGELLLSIVQSSEPDMTRDCLTVAEPRALHLEKGEVLIIGGGVLRISPTSAPGIVAGDDSLRFVPANGPRLTAIAGPLDVVLSAEIAQYPATVCRRS